MSFWKWWTSFNIVVIVTIIAQVQFGIFEYVMANDPTYITSLVVVIALSTSLMIGHKSYQLQFKNIHGTTNHLEPYWFAADVVMSIGMVGTLVGFLLVLTSAFTDIDTSSQEAMKEVIGELAAGMGVALLTSLAGLISSIILKSQLVMLENSQDETK